MRGVFAETKGGTVGTVWRYWTGRRWMWRSTICNSMMAACVSPLYDKWRGLAEKPKVSA